jgi:spore coat polysaccharide biosynthesis predicted glycosyltransferase SpsG
MAHLDYYYADVLLNQNINAERLDYSCEPCTRLLLGTRYTLLRSEFLAWQGWQREIPKAARKVLVTLGGGDPDNQTLKVIRALQRVDVDGLEAVVVVGASNPHFQKLQSAAYQSQFSMRLVQNASNMPELMTWADVAISAGGTTCWEMAFMGLPTVVLVLAENQQGIAAGLGKAGVVLNLGWYTEASITQIANTLAGLFEDRGLRRQISQRGRKLVDGLGSERVVKFLQTQSHFPI